MRKREFNNRMSLRGAYLYATWQSQQNKIVGRDPHVGFSMLLRMTYFKIGRSLDDCLRNRGMTATLWILVSSMSMISTVRAECVPTPDCVEIGYTATSCTGDSLKCPFDTSKLFCVPCDTKYKYTCTQTGQKGKGSSCDGKYIECECNEGYDLVDGSCVISCAYTLTSLPTGCSAVSDSCVKNGTTYYSSTCTSCKNGYTINAGTCKANTCSGYYSSKTGCSNYSTCQSGTTTKYKCTACNNGYTLNSAQCKANPCDGYKTSTDSNCSSYNTCLSGTTTKYRCKACKSGYTLCEENVECIDTNCYTELTGKGHDCIDIYASTSWCDGDSCTGANGETYYTGNTCVGNPFDQI